jgi:hypothetical protein
MRWRQEAGLDNALFLDLIENRDAGKDRAIPAFSDAADEVVQRTAAKQEAEPVSGTGPKRQRSGMKSEIDMGANVATGAGLGIISILGVIADGLTGSTPAPRPRQPEAEPSHRADPFDEIIAANQAREQREREDAADEYRRRQLANNTRGIQPDTVDERRLPDIIDLDPADAAEREIDETYARAIAGLRRLPRHERPHALRAAREIRMESPSRKTQDTAPRQSYGVEAIGRVSTEMTARQTHRIVHIFV